MPSPFPGMDPYLEEPILWAGFHAGLMVTFQEMLIPQIRPAYWADVEERVYVDVVDDRERGIRPDVTITRTSRKEPPTGPGSRAVAAPAVTVEIPLMGPFKEHSIKIMRRATHEIVTIIEILSPTNKRPHGAGRAAYLAKRAEVLASSAHLVEIDLLREGERPPVKGALPRSEYVALLHRRPRRPVAEVFPILLRERLPVLPIPLLEGDADVALDLQAALQTTYDRGGYDLELDYRRESDPALPPEHAAWAGTLLSERGLR